MSLASVCSLLTRISKCISFWERVIDGGGRKNSNYGYELEDRITDLKETLHESTEPREFVLR